MSPRLGPLSRAIVVGAQISSPRVLARLLCEQRVSRSDLLIGVDGGVWALASREVRKLGLQTQFALGDWDSLSDHGSPAKFLRGIQHLTLPREKDRSDLHYALDVATSSRGITEVVCFGVTGGRADHHLASLYELGEFAHLRGRRGVRISAQDKGESYHWVAPGTPLRLNVAKGAFISLFAHPGSAEGITTRGLKYPLTRESLNAGSRGLSNLCTERQIQVSLRRGTVLLVLNKA